MVAHSVNVIILQGPGLPHADSTLMTGIGAKAIVISFIFQCFKCLTIVKASLDFLNQGYYTLKKSFVVKTTKQECGGSLEFYDVLKRVGLFQGIGPVELKAMLECLQAQTAYFQRGKLLLTAGDKPERVGIVLDGELHVIREDVDGNRTLIAALSASDIYAEALCCAQVEESPVSVMADTAATVLQLHFARVLHTCPRSCDHHQKLIGNMLRLVAQKNLYLQNRLELVGARSIRAKVLGYLSHFVEKRGEGFTIPLNREEMADYLCVERSALSHELMRMKGDGLIDYKKNWFQIL